MASSAARKIEEDQERVEKLFSTPEKPANDNSQTVYKTPFQDDLPFQERRPFEIGNENFSGNNPYITREQNKKIADARRRRELGEDPQFHADGSEKTIPKSLDEKLDPQKRFAQDSKNKNKNNKELEEEENQRRKEESLRNRFIAANDNQENLNRAKGLNAQSGILNANLSKQKQAARMKKNIAAVKNVFKKRKIIITDDEAVKVIDSGMKAHTPFFMYMFAGIKDFYDLMINPIALGFIGLGAVPIVGIPFLGVGAFIQIVGPIAGTVIYLPVFRIWKTTYNKSAFGSVKVGRKVNSALIVGDVARTLVGALPLIGAIPESIWGVYSHTKLCKELMRKRKASVK